MSIQRWVGEAFLQEVYRWVKNNRVTSERVELGFFGPVNGRPYEHKLNIHRYFSDEKKLHQFLSICISAPDNYRTSINEVRVIEIWKETVGERNSVISERGAAHTFTPGDPYYASLSITPVMESLTSPQKWGHLIFNVPKAGTHGELEEFQLGFVNWDTRHLGEPQQFVTVFPAILGLYGC